MSAPRKLPAISQESCRHCGGTGIARRKRPLTTRQHEVLCFIEECIERKSVSPTYNEIMNRFGYRSSATVRELVDSLVEKGWISRTPYRTRALEVL
jgi:SOS-response transcriptional repressor LexA